MPFLSAFGGLLLSHSCLLRLVEPASLVLGGSFESVVQELSEANTAFHQLQIDDFAFLVTNVSRLWTADFTSVSSGSSASWHTLPMVSLPILVEVCDGCFDRVFGMRPSIESCRLIPWQKGEVSGVRRTVRRWAAATPRS